jgi:CBS domain-containing protein
LTLVKAATHTWCKAACRADRKVRWVQLQEGEMLVKNVMTTPVIGVDPTASVADAARLMLGHKISGLPVMTPAGELVGMISEGDFLRRSELGTDPHLAGLMRFLESSGRQADTYVHTHGRKVAEVMTTRLRTVPPGAALADAVEIMLKHHVKRLPVVEGGRIVGIVSRSDLMRTLLEALPSGKPDGDDDRIRKAVKAELAAQSWGGAIGVSVRGGAVTLGGTIFEDRARAAALVAAENVPGVKSVTDEMMWIEPMSGMVVLPDRTVA